MFQSFSKIWIVVAVAVFAVVGVFCWQYFGTQKENEISQEKTTKLEKSEFDVGATEDEFVEISLNEIEQGENEIGEISIEGINVFEKGELPAQIKIIPAAPDRIDSGYCLLYKDERIGSDSSGMFADWVVFEYNNYKYILPLEKNTGTSGPSFFSDIYVFNQKTKELKRLKNSNGLSFREFTVFLYQDNLYGLFFDQGKGGWCYWNEGIEIISLSKNDLIDRKNFWGTYYRCSYPPLEVFVDGTLIEKDRELYMKIENGYVYYPKGLMFEDVRIYWGAVPNFYLLDNGKFKESAKDFKFVYLNNAKQYDDILKIETWKISSEAIGLDFSDNIVYAAGPPAESEFDITDDWLSPLLGRTLNLIFADEADKAWKTFDRDFIILSEKHPLPDQKEINPEQIKREIEEDLIKTFPNFGIIEEKNKNAVVDYFENIELQYEIETQKQEIFTALNDILNLSEEQLEQKKYKDYVGKENQWDLSTLIYRYFVPNREGKFIGDNFYHDIKSEEAQKQIEQILEEYF